MYASSPHQNVYAWQKAEQSVASMSMVGLVFMSDQCLKYGGITAHLGSDKLNVGSDKTKIEQ